MKDGVFFEWPLCFFVYQAGGVKKKTNLLRGGVKT